MTAVTSDAKNDSWHPYRPEIDGLRALAVVAVIINHFNKDILPSGYLGVDIFFVISGFVITSSLAGRPSRNFGDFLAGFYTRRIKRLVPALVLFVAVTSILICLFNPNPDLSLKTGIASLFGLSNLYLFKQSIDYFSPSTEFNVFTHTWSLGVEEQFYFIFSFLVWFTGFGRLTKKGSNYLFLVMTTLSVASLITFVYLYQTNQSAAYFLMPTRLWEMSAGCLLFLGLKHPNSCFLRGLENIPPLFVTAGIVGVLFIPLQFAVTATIAVVVLTAVLISCLRSGTTGYELFTHQKVVYIGLISYSLYLWHWGVLSLSRWTIGIHWWSVPFQVVLMMLLAIGSYRYVETPLRRSDWSILRLQTIGYGIGASATAILLPFIPAKHSESFLYLGNPEAQFKSSHPKPPMCNIFNDGSTAFSISDKCGEGGRSAKTIFLLGDSHIEQFDHAIYRFAQKHGYAIRTVWGNSCQFPNSFIIPRHPDMARYGTGLECTKYQQHVENSLLNKVRSGDIVFVADALYFYFPRASRSDYRTMSGDVLTIPDAAKLFKKRFLSLADQLNSRGAKVVLYIDAPLFPNSSGIACQSEWFRPKRLHSESCFTKMDDYNWFRWNLFTWVDEWVDAKTKFAWDGLDSRQCSDRVCHAQDFRDSNHFTEDYAQYLFDKFSNRNLANLLK
jgi:peptidoglycan/LPS O-acetylase OafA/YrhL